MEKLLLKTAFFLFLFTNSIIVFGQTGIFFDPITPCLNKPTRIYTDTNSVSMTYSSEFTWWVDNNWVHQGWGYNGYEINYSFTSPGLHNVRLIAQDSFMVAGSWVWFDFDTTQTIFVDSVCSTNLISGSAYMDENNNGVFDSSDVSLASQKIKLSTSNQDYFTFSDQNGDYHFDVNSGTYDVAPVLDFPYDINGPANSASYTVQFNGAYNQDSLGCDFGLFTDSVLKDLAVFMNATVMRPGFGGQLDVRVRNKGSNPATGTLMVNLNNITTFGSSIPVEDSLIGQSAYFTFKNLMPNQMRNFRIFVDIDSTMMLGTPYGISAFVFPIVGDLDPVNNVDTLGGVIVGSYDPNDKLVFPSDDTINLVKPGKPLTYTIRFQNTGTFLAEKVRIVDSLEGNLDLSTFEMIGASHNYSYQVYNNRRIVWIFDDIMLPAEQDDGPNSHGFLKFRIYPDTNLSLGDTVYNSAEIYFDFNAPIITNTIVSTIEIPVIQNIREEVHISDQEIKIYPNPAKDRLNIKSESLNLIEAEILYSNGKTAFISDLRNQKSISLTGLSPGMYFIRILTDEGEVEIRKLIKE